MNCNDIEFKYIKEEEFLIYIDWLTRFKNPINNILRVSEKIITKNCIVPKYNAKKASEMSIFSKIKLAKFIWEKSLENLLKINVFSKNKIKDFLIYEELQTFNINNLINQIKSLEYENENLNIEYKTFREKNFFPLDEIVCYFEKQNQVPKFLNRLIFKRNTDLSNEDLFNAKDDFASIKLLFLTEGITEEKLLPVFANICGLDFSKHGIKLIAAGGKTHILKYYADIRQLLKIPVVILLDADGTDIINDLNSILEKKDNVYLISKGEIEDILPNSLIIKSINNYYSMLGNISENDLLKNEPMTKILYKLYKEKGFGEFHKAKFAQIIQDNIKTSDDISDEIRNIINMLKNKLELPDYSQLQ